MLFKLQDVGNVGAAPAIDRLIRIADYANVLLLLGEQTNQCELQRVSILILIYQQITKLIVIATADLRYIAQQPDRFDQQVIKVERVVLLQTLFVLLKDARNRSTAFIRELRP